MQAILSKITFKHYLSVTKVEKIKLKNDNRNQSLLRKYFSINIHYYFTLKYMDIVHFLRIIQRKFI